MTDNEKNEEMTYKIICGIAIVLIIINLIPIVSKFL